MEAPRPLPGSRRLRARHLARGLRLGALTLALLGLAAAPARAAAGPGVVFALPDGTSRSLSGAELTTGYSAVYTTPAHPGEATQPFTRSGMPVQAALEAAGVGPYGYLTIARPTGTTAYLPATYFEEPSPFEGGKLAIFSSDVQSTRFIRPLLANDPNDVNAEDNIATVSGEAMVVGVHQGKVVQVNVTPPKVSTPAGTPVELIAVASGGEPDEAFTYKWSFGDGSPGTEGGTASHPFAGSGTYLVRVTAQGSDGSGGESAPVEVVVGNPPTTETPGATTAPEQPKKKEKPTGSPGKGREGRGGSGSKPSTSGKGKNPGRNSSTQRGTSPADRSSSNDSPESAPPSTTAPFPAAPEPVRQIPPATLEGSPVGTSPEPPGCCSGEVPTGEPPRQTASQGNLVEGILVGKNLGPVPATEATSPSSPDQGSSSAAGAVAGDGPGPPVVALIVVALLAGGALFEWRRSRVGG